MISIFLIFIFTTKTSFLFSHLNSPSPSPPVSSGPVCAVDRLAKVNRKMWCMSRREGIALET